MAISINRNTFDALGGEYTDGKDAIIITKSSQRTLFSSVMLEENSWCHVISSGQISAWEWQINVVVDENNTGEDRSWNITVETEDEQASFEISQTYTATLSGIIITVNPSVDISADGDTCTVDVKTVNGNDSLSSASVSSGAFCSLTSTTHGVTGADGNLVTRFVFTFGENTSISRRSETFEFVVSNGTRTHTLTLEKYQAAASQEEIPGTISLSSVSVAASATSAASKVSLSNIDVSTLVADVPSWVTSASFSTTGTTTMLNLVFPQNNTSVAKTGSIVVSGTDINGDTITGTASISQQGVNTNIGSISMNDVTVDADDVQASIPVTTQNITTNTLSASYNSEWISSASISVSGSSVTLSVEFGDNTVAEERYADITVSGQNQYGVTKSDSVRITQKAAKIYTDFIYVIDYDGEDFTFDGGFGDDGKAFYAGNLGFDLEHPIESVCHFETKEIQKIYWVDGQNVVRFANIAATREQRASWDDTIFDVDRPASFSLDVTITKDNSGENRANGVVQYLISYFNKHGQETGYVWMSDIVYLSPLDRGGDADGTNSNCVTLNISGLDTSYEYFRVYSVFRSSLDGQAVAYLVDEQKVLPYTDNTGTHAKATVIDDGAHLTVQEPTRLLYLGSKHLVAGTMAHKDNVLFLGDLISIGRKDYSEMESQIRQYMFGVWNPSTGRISPTPFVEGTTYLSSRITFAYSGSGNPIGYIPIEGNKYMQDIPYEDAAGLYPYTSQLNLVSSDMLSFKGGEKYRFALKFQYPNGTETDAFWIGDAENTLYPVIDNDHHMIKRVCAVCELPSGFVAYLKTTGFKSVRLCIAEASFADRSVKAQGIVNPTMFNVWERYQKRIYSIPSWMTRVRGCDYPYLHFNSLERSDTTLGESQCNWWEENIDHNPYYQYKNYKGANANPTYLLDLGRESDWDKLMLVYRIRYKKNTKAGLGALADATLGGGGIGSVVVGAATNKVKYKVLIYAIKAKIYHSDVASVVSDVENIDIAAFDDEENKSNGKAQHQKEFNSFWTQDQGTSGSKMGWYHDIPYTYTDSGGTHTVVGATLRLETAEIEVSKIFNQGGAKTESYQKLVHAFLDMDLDNYVPKAEEFVDWCTWATHARDDHKHRIYVNQNLSMNETTAQDLSSMYAAVNSPTKSMRWIQEGEYSVTGDKGAYPAAYYKKHLMFIDENMVTLDSPELDYEAVEFDRNDALKFRIVGVAKMHSVMSDYTIDATHSSVDGSSYDEESFSGTDSGNHNLNGLISWPLWREYALQLTKNADPNKENSERSSSDYYLGSRIIRYMMYMWQRNGSISGYTGRTDIIEGEEGEEEEKTIVDTDYSKLNHKVWANLHFSHTTMFLASPVEYGLDDVRISRELGSSGMGVNVGDETYDYNGSVQFSVSMPGNLKYPLYYCNIHPTDTYKPIMADGAFLYSNMPVQFEYRTKNHAVLSLGTNPSLEKNDGCMYYRQSILPACFEEEVLKFDDMRTDSQEIVDDEGNSETVAVTGALLPWESESMYNNYLFVNDSAIPYFIAEAYSDAGIQYRYTASVSKTGDGLLYINALKAAINEFGADDGYITIKVGYPDTWKMVISVMDINISEGSSYYTIQIKDPRGLGYSDGTDLGPGQTEKTIRVKYYNASSGTNAIQYGGTGTLHIWTNTIESESYGYRDYDIRQPAIYGAMGIPVMNSMLCGSLNKGDKYIFIGEIYKDYSSVNPADDKRYGGIYSANVENNRFINAGPAMPIDNMHVEDVDHNPISTIIYANQGDTYFQRYDSLRVKPFSNDALNQIVDITSAMLETHVNLDGRTDLYRGIREIASIDTTKFGQINRVYSQKNNYIVRRDTDEDFNKDDFRSALTWTLPKADMADVDEWTHITLATSLKLDGDKGICRALRKFRDTIIAFQDRGISEVMFNSRVQLSTDDGVPVEVGNSGKVSGARYITNKFGCINKWSSVEGKRALYFVDNINKAFCSVSVGERGQLGVGDISTGKGFGVWFRTHNNLEPWTPKDFNNIVSFNDKVFSDIYIVKNESMTQGGPTLVYNETLGEFTSFFDYGSVPMITNIEDRLISFKDHKLWLQNEGKYCNFFGTQKDFWMQYKVTPNPYGDKIWTNLEYRADFYRVLNGESEQALSPEHYFEDGNNSKYQPDETFSFVRFWNEYQTTETNETGFVFNPEKKFRIWRYQIPRAKQDNTYNPYGLDRIRNPWLNILLKKKYTSASDVTNQDLMQMHDMTVIYYE